MPDYKITVSDEGDRVLQKALTADNAHLKSTGKSEWKGMNEFLTAQIEQEFGISAAELSATQQKEAVSAVLSKMSALPVEAIAEISVAVDAAASKYPGKP